MLSVLYNARSTHPRRQEAPASRKPSGAGRQARCPIPPGRVGLRVSRPRAGPTRPETPRRGPRPLRRPLDVERAPPAPPRAESPGRRRPPESREARPLRRPGEFGLPARLRPEKPGGPAARDARQHGPRGGAGWGAFPGRVGGPKPGERRRGDPEAVPEQLLLFHVVPQGLAQVLLGRLQLAHKGRHCSPRLTRPQTALPQ